MPPRGVRKSSRRGRQYEHIKEAEREQGASDGRAEEIAARTVNKERARSGESRTSSRSSTRGRSASSRGGKRSGRDILANDGAEFLGSQLERQGIDLVHEQCLFGIVHDAGVVPVEDGVRTALGVVADAAVAIAPIRSLSSLREPAGLVRSKHGRVVPLLRAFLDRKHQATSTPWAIGA